MVIYTRPLNPKSEKLDFDPSAQLAEVQVDSGGGAGAGAAAKVLVREEGGEEALVLHGAPP